MTTQAKNHVWYDGRRYMLLGIHAEEPPRAVRNSEFDKVERIADSHELVTDKGDEPG